MSCFSEFFFAIFKLFIWFDAAGMNALNAHIVLPCPKNIFKSEIIA